MPWKICFTLPTNPPRTVCFPIPVVPPPRLFRWWPWPPQPEPFKVATWLDDPRVKEATLKDLVTLNVLSEVAADLSPTVRKSVQAAIETSFKDLKLPADYSLHSVEK